MSGKSQGILRWIASLQSITDSHHACYALGPVLNPAGGKNLSGSVVHSRSLLSGYVIPSASEDKLKGRVV